MKLSQLTINTETFASFSKHRILDEYFILFALSVLKKTGKISEAKFKGQIMALRNKTLLTKKNTYHCTINNRWYDREPVIVPFVDCLEEFYVVNITIEDLVKDIQYYHNSNYNFAINTFVTCYLYICLDQFYPYSKHQLFTNYCGIDLPFTFIAVFDSSYCDCCGHGSDSNEFNIRETRNKFKALANPYFHSQKKGNLSKIPPIIS